MLRLLVLLLMLLLSGSIVAQQNCKNCGVAYKKIRLFKPELSTYILPDRERDTKYLFLDSMMIYERHGLFFETYNDKYETWRREIIGYTFGDMRTRKFYDYAHFSDTAQITQVYQRPAKQWMFFGEPRVHDKTISLPDTTLDGVNYHRVKGFFTEGGDTTLIETMYYLSEEERPIAYYGKTIVDGKRFSFVRLEGLDVASGIRTYSVMEITARDLTKEELKVFAAWKRNAEKYPVLKKEKTTVKNEIERIGARLGVAYKECFCKLPHVDVQQPHGR